jgi:hypothetical protein
MTTANLIPAGRRQAKRRRARTCVWAGACTAYAVVLLAGYGVCQALWGGTDRGVDEELRKAGTAAQTSARQTLALNRSLERARLALQANRAVGSQPDWSALLALLAQNLGDELVLNHCRLKPARVLPAATPAGSAEGTPASPAEKPRHFALEIEGYARSQAAVSQFVLRLEGTGLFNQVRLVKSNREPFLVGKAVAFRVECSLGPRKRASP